MKKEEYDTIKEIIEKFKADYPDKNTMKLPKAILGSKLNYNVNKQGKFCKELAYEHEWAKDTKGFLEIDIPAFEEWSSLIQERLSLVEQQNTQVPRYQELRKNVEEHRKLVANGEQLIKNMENEVESLKKKHEEDLKKIESLKEQKAHLQEENKKLDPNLKALHEEIDKEAKDIEAKRKSINEIARKKEEEKNFLIRRPLLKPDLEYGHSILWWLGISIVIFIFGLCLLWIINAVWINLSVFLTGISNNTQNLINSSSV